MAFVLTDFKTGDSSGNAPSIHTYITPDSRADVNTEGYFNPISDILTAGDLIYAVTGGTPEYVLFPVLSNSGGVVDVSDGTLITGVDSD